MCGTRKTDPINVEEGPVPFGRGKDMDRILSILFPPTSESYSISVCVYSCNTRENSTDLKSTPVFHFSKPERLIRRPITSPDPRTYTTIPTSSLTFGRK